MKGEKTCKGRLLRNYGGDSLKVKNPSETFRFIYELFSEVEWAGFRDISGPASFRWVFPAQLLLGGFNSEITYIHIRVT